MKKILFSLFALLLVASLTPAMHADDGDWVYLGKAHVDKQTDHKVISVGAAKGRYTHLRIDVESEDIEFDHIVVHYGDGEPETLHVRDVIPAGGHSRAIPLQGDRYVVSLELWYSRVHPSSDKPEVKLWGKR